MEEEEEIDLLLTDHELCGFILAVLTASSPVLPGTPCSLSTSTVGFLTKSGTFLLPIPENNGIVTDSVPKQKIKRRNKVGIGSGSVVHQIHVLAANRCLSVRGRVVKVSVREEGEGDGRVRVVVMVDVYLPMAIRSGWQFPKSGTLAAALFKHVSCNWEMRSLFLATYKDEGKSSYEDDKYMWNNSDCHVLQCNLHHSESESSKKKLFDIHEMFKTLPSAVKEQTICSTSIKVENVTDRSGIWTVSEDVLTTIIGSLSSRDLFSVSLTCRHLMSLALSITPCAKLKLFSHQQAAVDWMLKRECNLTVLPHPLYMNFSMEDRFNYYINSISGKISTGMAPTINDFRGGMFCDEPGLGKTITALSLILKTHGKLADLPPGVDAMWCMHNQEQRCAYYDLNFGNSANFNSRSTWKRSAQGVRRGSIFLSGMSSRLELSGNSNITPLKRSFDLADDQMDPFNKLGGLSYEASDSLPETHVLQGNRKPSNARRSLLDVFGRNSACPRKTRKKSNDTKQIHSPHDEDSSFLISCKQQEKSNSSITDLDETWVQCDACRKWRRLCGRNLPDATDAWFCSMNSDQLHQSCATREESWDQKQTITHLPGFYTKGTSPGIDQNVSYFVTVLKGHFSLLNSVTIKALNWLSDLSYDKLSVLERNGLTLPIVGICGNSGRQNHSYENIFQAFGLVRKLVRGRVSWHYPLNLKNLMFDTLALQIALTKPLDSFRFYLSRATLIIVPVNLVEHWKTQIEKHVVPGQLRVLVWTDHKRLSVHSLAWDYDIVITTFSRLSAEWSPRKRSILMQVHWLRIMLDEGHTLGSSLSLTNKLQMAISLIASNRWILTGTPTPNTPSSQLTHLQPMLKFLHEEAYGLDQRSWDVGILKPFEAEMEEGRSRLLQLLKRAMISARKKDLKNVPPCIKKVILLDFNEKHARSYNELVVTVRRNILMADWNDPSHVESLLNPKQWKFRSNTIRNIRLSCCVSGHIKVAEAGTDIQDTMDVLVQQGLDPLSENYELIRVALLCGGNCFRCKVWCRLPVITPCRHLLCLDCVALDSERCTLPVCGKTYEMQFPEELTRPENPNPKWPVPKDLIELQPSYRQDNWDPDWQSTSSSKVAYLVQRLKTLKEANRKFDFCENANDCTRFSPHSNCHSGFLTEGVCRKQHDLSSMVKLDKVIIFSQFLEHIHVIEQQLTIAGIDYVGMYSPMHSSNKMKSLMVFQQHPSCMALLMDGSAALGLDLSFVSHVFLMEPIWDRSMEEQVISRAHRMGATRAINVETLAMRGTIEEQMLQFLEDSTECRKAMKQDVRGTEFERTRVHRTLHDFAANTYLTRLGFVRTDNALE